MHAAGKRQKNLYQDTIPHSRDLHRSVINADQGSFSSMANEKKKYFLTPTWDYSPPPNGPIRLGNILASPADPVPPVLATPAAPATPSPSTGSTAVSGPDRDLDGISVSSHKTSVTYTRECVRAGSYGIYTKFLQQLGLPIGVDLDLTAAKSHTSTFEFERMDTEEFWPSPTFLQHQLAHPAVRAFLAQQWFHKRVYMIIGIKSVTGAKKASSRKETTLSGGIDAGVDLTTLAAGVPGVDVGGRVNPERRDLKLVEWTGSSDFVFAYRLLRVTVRGRGEGGFKSGEFVSGAMYALPEDGGEQHDYRTKHEISSASANTAWNPLLHAYRHRGDHHQQQQEEEEIYEIKECNGNTEDGDDDRDDPAGLDVVAMPDEYGENVLVQTNNTTTTTTTSTGATGSITVGVDDRDDSGERPGY